MSVNTAQLYADIEPVVRSKWGLGRKEVLKVRDQIFDSSETEEAMMETLEMGGPGILAPKQENQPINLMGMALSNVKRWTSATFAGGMQLSREAIMDSKTKEIHSASSLLGRAAEITPELLAAQYLDRSFDTAFPATWDGQPLFSLSHVRPGGGTYANCNSVAASLSESALEDVRVSLMYATDSAGLPAGLAVKKLVIPSSLTNTAEKITRSEKQLGSANNDPNVVRDLARGFIATPYVTNLTRWMVKTTASQGLFWKFREKIQFIQDNNPSVLGTLFLSFFRAYWGCENPRALWGVNAA